ncbi:MAG: dihydroorotase family protein [Thermoprotei archaeon]|nr:dihydroorotase family protein [Thermoprotei archaeon]
MTVRTVDKLLIGKAYFNSRVQEVAIAVDRGIIAGITKPSRAPQASTVIKVEGKRIIFPGMVDIHVHMRDLRQEYKEDWYTGTLSALRGGVTLIIDMPNNDPPMDSIDRIREKKRIAESKALVDYLFYLGYPKDLAEIERAKGEPIVGVKVYPEDFRRDLTPLIFKCAEKGLSIVVHPEEPEELRRDKFGVKAELIGVKRILKTLRNLNHVKVHVHLTHVSLREAAEQIILSRGETSNITFDVTIHHIMLDHSAYEKLGGLAYVRPPLRSAYDREYLFNLVRKGEPNAIVTDHAPHTLEEKMKDEPLPGFPGLEIAFPILFTQILERRIPISAVDLYSYRPAELFNIAKGSISVGNDADLIIINYGVERKVEPEKFASKAKYSPFKGWRLRCDVEKVMIRGTFVYESGTILVKKGYGRPGRRFKCRSSWNEA